MIRINLLTADKPRAAKKSRLPQVSLKGQQLTFGCALILIATGSFIGWRYYSMRNESVALDAEIAAAQQETVRLHSLIGEFQQFEQRRTQLQQRVGLIEQLRKDQTGPVHMLDQISLALPSMLWLTDLKQTPGQSEVLIEGRCTGLTGLSDFVTNLEASGYFKKSVEIVSTTIESQTQGGDLVKFAVKAQFQAPGTAVAAAAVKPVPGAPAAAAAAAKPTT